MEVKEKISGLKQEWFKRVEREREKRRQEESLILSRNKKEKIFGIKWEGFKRVERERKKGYNRKVLYSVEIKDKKYLEEN